MTFHPQNHLAAPKNVENLMRSLTIGGYHQHRKDLRKWICLGKICDPKARQASPTANNTQSWHTKYLLRLHNDLPLLPANECKAVATILPISPKFTKKNNPLLMLSLFYLNNNHTAIGGRYKLVKPNQLGTTQKLSQKCKETVKMKKIISKKQS